MEPLKYAKIEDLSIDLAGYEFVCEFTSGGAVSVEFADVVQFDFNDCACVTRIYRKKIEEKI